MPQPDLEPIPQATVRNKMPLLGEPFFVMKNDQFTKTGAGQTQAKVEKKRFSAGTTIKVSPRIGLTRPMGKAQMPPVMVRETSFLEPFYAKNDQFTMTGSGQTSGNLQKRVAFFAGPWNGYDTSWGPDVAYSNLWVNDWLSIFSDPIAKLGAEPPLILTRGVWAGGQRHGAVLWSSDILSSFEELAAMVPQGVHTSLSGIPWWCDFRSRFVLTCCPHVLRSRSFARVLRQDHRRWRLLPERRESLAVHAGAHCQMVPVWSLLSDLPHPRLPHLQERAVLPTGA